MNNIYIGEFKNDEITGKGIHIFNGGGWIKGDFV